MSEQLREEKRKIEELHEVASEMEACKSKAEVYRLAVDAAEGILEFDICGIDMEEDGYLVPKASSSEMPNDGYEALEADEGLAGRTFQNGESFLIPDVRTMSEAEPVQEQYRSILSVPVGDCGVFQAGSREAMAFDEDDLELAELLMSHVTEVISRIDSQSALRESEEKYRTLVEGSHDAIFIHSDERFRFVNDRVSELTGYDEDELLGMPVSKVVHEDDRDRVSELIERREREGETPHYQLRIRTKDGDVRYVELSVQSISYDGEQAHLGSARDVTERRRRKQKVERQNERLKEFASVVSHDLRNPLNVAQGHLELARETDERRHFEKTGSALGRMESLIEDLLTLARQGQDVRETEPIDLESVVRRAWATVSTGTATLDVDDGLGEIEADDGRLQELFENLFRNAVEHADDGVTLSVGTLDGGTPCEESSPNLDAEDPPAAFGTNGFYVADDGPGIPESEREKVFEHGHTTADDGSGLGLAIVSSIVDAHGWNVRVCESESGGARFEVATA
ncbi:PAS domain S-box protein (plasmid) [Halorussus limi]|uniref:histidine kinase n=1 Tax=Halorussus limi TaxID=2938695 RepID=A0A8U0HZ59_9EURY|nr:PAS domain S-box protein [Halorussus limi]UPV76320.1 PAS domain S-box protein [Halorussus limi]